MIQRRAGEKCLQDFGTENFWKTENNNINLEHGEVGREDWRLLNCSSSVPSGGIWY